jgi:D-glycero-D-manno-heptose 1,7-bisphosphate phosphatase
VRRAVFLDRDGTLTANRDFLVRAADLELVPGAAQAVARLNRAGWAVVVVTNQSGLARGLFDEEELEAIHARLRDELLPGRVDGVYVCPHRAEDGCICRKPSPVLFERAARALGLDVGGSWIVGDKWTDLVPARALGCRAALVRTGYGRDEEAAGPPGELRPDVVADDVAGAVEEILKRGQEPFSAAEKGS